MLTLPLKQFNDAVSMLKGLASRAANDSLKKVYLFTSPQGDVIVSALDASTTMLQLTLGQDTAAGEWYGTLDPTRLLNALSAFSGDVTLTLGKDEIMLSDKSRRATVKAVPDAHYTRIDDALLPVDLTFSPEDLQLFTAVSKAAASDTSITPHLCGVNFRFSGGRLDVGATDTFRMLYALDLPTIYKGDLEFTLSPVSLNLLEEACAYTDAWQVEVNLSDKAVQFSAPGFSLRAQKVNGKFPAYRRYTEVTPTASCLADYSELIKAAKQFKRIVDYGEFHVTNASKLVLFGYDDAGEFEAEMPVDNLSGEVHLYLTSTFLKDALEALELWKPQQVKLSLSMPPDMYAVHLAVEGAPLRGIIIPREAKAMRYVEQKVKVLPVVPQQAEPVGVPDAGVIVKAQPPKPSKAVKLTVGTKLSG